MCVCVFFLSLFLNQRQTETVAVSAKSKPEISMHVERAAFGASLGTHCGSLNLVAAPPTVSECVALPSTPFASSPEPRSDDGLVSFAHRLLLQNYSDRMNGFAKSEATPPPRFASTCHSTMSKISVVFPAGDSTINHLSKDSKKKNKKNKRRPLFKLATLKPSPICHSASF